VCWWLRHVSAGTPGGVFGIVWEGLAGSGDCGWRPGWSAGGGGRCGWVQLVAAGSVLSFSNAALSASVHGQAAGRCSLAWRAESASRAAMCSSR
jgi:hypothetical protein